MKKKILSLILAVMMIFSCMPYVAAEEDITPVLIGTYDEFVSFLENAENSGISRAYYKLSADIVADGSEVIGMYDAENISLDGDGHTISGLNIENALFATVDNSFIRNIVFDNVSVTGVMKKSSLNLALIAQKAKEGVFISNIIFRNCNITIPVEKKVYAGFVAATNNAYITNCIVENTSVIRTDNSYIDTDAKIAFGGIVNENTGEGAITNCISELSYDVTPGPEYTIAGIAAENNSLITFCYADIAEPAFEAKYGDVYAIAESGNSYHRHLVNKENGKFAVEEAVSEKDYSAMDVYEFAAEMSETVMNENTVNLIDKRDNADLPSLWSVENNTLGLSFDGKTGQVYVNFGDDIANENCKDISSIEKYRFSDANAKEILPGQKYSVRVGDYDSNGNYKRNTVTLNIATKDYKVVNAVVCRPLQSYVKKMQNTMDSVSGTYSDMFIATSKVYHVEYVDNTATINMYPFCTSLSLSNISDYDEIVYVYFDGSGTETSPYVINEAYELNALAFYVANGFSSGGIRYNEAYYVLGKDITFAKKTLNPIGRYSATGETSFKGVFDGKGHKITNWKINTSDTYLGIFGYVEGLETTVGYRNAEIKNITIDSGSVQIGDVASISDIRGLLAGQVKNTVVRGCVAIGNIMGSSYVGGLVGYAYNSEIINSGSYVDICTYHQAAIAGGLVGKAEDTTIENCYTAVNMYNYDYSDDAYLNVGMIAGLRDNSDYVHCFTGKCSKLAYYTDLDYGEELTDADLIKNAFCQELFRYSIMNNLDTVFGMNTTSPQIPVAVIPAKNSYVVECVNTSNGTFRFSGNTSADWKIFNDGEEVTLILDSEKEITGVDFRDFEGNTLTVDYKKNSDGTFTFKAVNGSLQVRPAYGTAMLDGQGTKESPYKIASFDDLVAMAEQVNTSSTEEHYLNAYYQLVADIDCNGRQLPVIGYNPEDSENAEHAFSGTFDGDGHRIYNGCILSEETYAGLFFDIKGAIIRDVYFEDITIYVHENIKTAYMGSLIAYVVDVGIRPSQFINISINNCNFVGKAPETTKLYLSSMSFFVGVAMSDTEIINCVVKNSYFDVENIESIKTKALLFPRNYSEDVRITVKNVLALYEEMEYGLFSAIADEHICDAENVYYTQTLSAGDTEIHLPYAQKKDYSDVCTAKFAEKMNKFAKENIAEYSPATWSAVNEETDIVLSIGDAEKIHNISYDDIFYSSTKESICMDSAPDSFVSGETVELLFRIEYDFSSFRIETASGRTVNFEVSQQTADPGLGIIRFRMPYDDVYVTAVDSDVKYLAPEGIGTEDDPYILRYSWHLSLVAKVINGLASQYKPAPECVDYDKAYFVLGGDIDMTGVTWSGIGTDDISFSGVLDGKDHSIRYLNVNSVNEDGQKNGLFVNLGSSAIVQNLRIDYAEVYNAVADGYAGVIVMTNNGTIRECSLTNVNIKTVSLDNTGAIAGVNQENGVIENCVVAYSSVKDVFGKLNGCYIACSNDGLISNCIIYDCFASSDGYDIAVQIGNTPENVYHNSENTADNYKTDDQFASGEVAYLLNNASSLKENVWRQNLFGSEILDAYPVPDQTHYVVDMKDGVYINRTDMQSSRYVLVGDIDNDGKVHPYDAQMLRYFMNRDDVITLKGMVAADVNADGAVDGNDLEILENYFLNGSGKNEYSIGESIPIVYRMPENCVYLGDADNNFEITMQDYAILLDCIGKDDIDAHLRCKLDFSLDGVLDDIDAELFRYYFECRETGAFYSDSVGKVAYCDDKHEPDAPVTPPEQETPDEPAEDNKCDDCGMVHSCFIVEIICLLVKMIRFLQNLFA